MTWCNVSRPTVDERRTEDRYRESNSAPLRVAVVGRPNVGKSTLINRLLGFERSVVDATPGTTRDSVDTPFELLGEPCILIDTAGIRRKARIDDRIERFQRQPIAQGGRTRRFDYSCHRRPGETSPIKTRRF